MLTLRMKRLQVWKDLFYVWKEILQAWKDRFPLWNERLLLWKIGLRVWKDLLHLWKARLPLWETEARHQNAYFLLHLGYRRWIVEISKITGRQFVKEYGIYTKECRRVGDFLVSRDQLQSPQFQGSSNMNPVERSQKNRRLRLEGSGGNILGAGFDIDAQGNKKKATLLEIGLKLGKHSSRTPARNLAPRLLGLDGEGHFKFQDGTGMKRAFFNGRQLGSLG